MFPSPDRSGTPDAAGLEFFLVPKERLKEAPFWHLEKCKPAKSEWSGGQDKASYKQLSILQERLILLIFLFCSIKKGTKKY